MSSGVTIYSVDLDSVVRACGSQDERLVQQILARFGRELEQSDEWFKDEISDGAPASADAIRSLIAGGPIADDFGFAYGYAYEKVVAFFGKDLENTPFSPCDSGFLEEVDSALDKTAIGAQLRLSTLAFGGAPVKFPRPDDSPSFGFWDAALVARTAPLVAGMENAERGPVAKAIGTVREWLSFASSRREAVVGFYY